MENMMLMAKQMLLIFRLVVGDKNKTVAIASVELLDDKHSILYQNHKQGCSYNLWQ
jgi:hypothetical protein